MCIGAVYRRFTYRTLYTHNIKQSHNSVARFSRVANVANKESMKKIGECGFEISEIGERTINAC
jgi:hypothetical protein